MTKMQVMTLVKEMKQEEMKTVDRVHTGRYEELFHDPEKKGLRAEEAKVFKCAYCGEMCGYFDLEDWVCDFEEEYYECSVCYEDEMGDDL